MATFPMRDQVLRRERSTGYITLAVPGLQSVIVAMPYKHVVTAVRVPLHMATFAEYAWWCMARFEGGGRLRTVEQLVVVLVEFLFKGTVQGGWVGLLHCTWLGNTKAVAATAQDLSLCLLHPLCQHLE